MVVWFFCFTFFFSFFDGGFYSNIDFSNLSSLGWQPPKMYDSGPRDIRHSLTPILPPACLFNPVETSRPLRVSEPYPECLDVIADFYHPPAGFATGVEIRTNVENPFESTTTTAGSDTSPASGGGCPRRLTPQAVGFPDFVGVPDLEYDEITDEKILGAILRTYFCFFDRIYFHFSSSLLSALSS